MQFSQSSDRSEAERGSASAPRRTPRHRWKLFFRRLAVWIPVLAAILGIVKVNIILNKNLDAGAAPPPQWNPPTTSIVTGGIDKNPVGPGPIDPQPDSDHESLVEKRHSKTKPPVPPAVDGFTGSTPPAPGGTEFPLNVTRLPPQVDTTAAANPKRVGTPAIQPVSHAQEPSLRDKYIDSTNWQSGTDKAARVGIIALKDGRVNGDVTSKLCDCFERAGFVTNDSLFTTDFVTDDIFTEMYDSRYSHFRDLHIQDDCSLIALATVVNSSKTDADLQGRFESDTTVTTRVLQARTGNAVLDVEAKGHGAAWTEAEAKEKAAKDLDQKLKEQLHSRLQTLRRKN